MPFKSKSQESWMFANKPKMAKDWANETPDQSSLPQHVKPKTHQASLKTRLSTRMK